MARDSDKLVKDSLSFNEKDRKEIEQSIKEVLKFVDLPGLDGLTHGGFDDLLGLDLDEDDLKTKVRDRILEHFDAKGLKQLMDITGKKVDNEFVKGWEPTNILNRPSFKEYDETIHDIFENAIKTAPGIGESLLFLYLGGKKEDRDVPSITETLEDLSPLVLEFYSRIKVAQETLRMYGEIFQSDKPYEVKVVFQAKFYADLYEICGKQLEGVMLTIQSIHNEDKPSSKASIGEKLQWIKNTPYKNLVESMDKDIRNSINHDGVLPIEKNKSVIFKHNYRGELVQKKLSFSEFEDICEKLICLYVALLYSIPRAIPQISESYIKMLEDASF